MIKPQIPDYIAAILEWTLALDRATTHRKGGTMIKPKTPDYIAAILELIPLFLFRRFPSGANLRERIRHAVGWIQARARVRAALRELYFRGKSVPITEIITEERKDRNGNN